MNLMNKSILLTTTFMAAATLAVRTLAASAVGITMIMPASAQGDNMTGGGGNATEGNMTVTDMAGSGLATPPTMTP
jgi:hypothetical protein